MDPRLLEAKLIDIQRRIKKPAVWAKPPAPTDDGPESDGGYLTDLRIEKDGSVRMYLKNHPMPARVYPDGETVNLTALYKRLLPLMANSFSKQNWLQRIITLLAIQFNFNILPDWFEYMFKLNLALLKDDHYSQPVKELRRVLKGKLNDNLLDAVTLVFEYDTAYRYRLQDTLVELDKSKLTGYFSTKQELERLFDIIIKREYSDGVKYKQFKKIISLLIIIPNIRKQVIDILKEINIDEIKFSEEDIYWTNQFGVYNYRGLTWQERKQENKEKYFK